MHEVFESLAEFILFLLEVFGDEAFRLTRKH